MDLEIMLEQRGRGYLCKVANEVIEDAIKSLTAEIDRLADSYDTMKRLGMSDDEVYGLVHELKEKHNRLNALIYLKENAHKCICLEEE